MNSRCRSCTRRCSQDHPLGPSKSSHRCAHRLRLQSLSQKLWCRSNCRRLVPKVATIPLEDSPLQCCCVFCKSCCIPHVGFFARAETSAIGLARNAASMLRGRPSNNLGGKRYRNPSGDLRGRAPEPSARDRMQDSSEFSRFGAKRPADRRFSLKAAWPQTFRRWTAGGRTHDSSRKSSNVGATHSR